MNGNLILEVAYEENPSWVKVSSGRSFVETDLLQTVYWEKFFLQKYSVASVAPESIFLGGSSQENILLDDLLLENVL